MSATTTLPLVTASLILGLEGTVDRLRKAWKKLVRRQPYRTIWRGGAYAIECVNNPTTTHYLALSLSPLSMRKIGVVIAPLQPGNQLEDVFNAVRPHG